jgi:hypothetical protein
MSVAPPVMPASNICLRYENLLDMATRMAVDAQIKPTSMVERKQRISIESAVTTLLFVATISLLAISTVQRFSIRPGTVAIDENRTFSGCPHLRFTYDSLRAFPPGFESFYNDRFAYRTSLIYTMAWWKYKYFDVSTTGKVIAGRNGWLYYMDGGDEEILRHTPLFSDQELANWTCVLTERKAWCDARHIKFLFVITRSKATIYPEFAPLQYTALSTDSKADQLLRFLREHTDIETLDLKKPLLQAKSMGRIYSKTDTHWNRLGSFIGYRTIMGRLKQWFPQLQPLKLADLKVTKDVPFSGDLANMMGIEHRVMDSNDEYEPKSGYTWKQASFPPPFDLNDLTHCWDPFATETNLKNAPKAFFVRDSFIVMPQPLISQTFKHVYFNWSPFVEFPAQAIANDKPDVVVLELIERQLNRPLPKNPPELLPAVPRQEGTMAIRRNSNHSRIADSARQPTR